MSRFRSDADLMRSLTAKLSCVAVPVQAVEMLFTLLEVVDDADLDMMDAQGKPTDFCVM